MIMVELDVETKNRLNSRLKRKLGFLEDKAKEAVAAYEDFLILLINVKDFHAQKLFPPPLIDQVWQLHVLDTMNYEVDCIAMCGCIIHYNPDLDVDLGSSERAVRQMSTNIAYDARFGERLSKSDAWKFDASLPNLPTYINDYTSLESLPEGAPSYERENISTKPAKRVSLCNVQEGSPSKKNRNVVQTGTRTNSFQNVSHALTSDKSSFFEPNTQKCLSTFSQSETPLESQKTLTDGLSVIEMDGTKSVKVTATNGEVYIVYIDKTSQLVDVRSAINCHGSINPYLCGFSKINGERVSNHSFLFSDSIKDLYLDVPSFKNMSVNKVLTPQKPVEVFAFSTPLIPATFNLSVKGSGNVRYKIKVTQETTEEDFKELFISTSGIKFVHLKYLRPNQAQMIKHRITIQFDSCGATQRIHANGGWTVKDVKCAISSYFPEPDSNRLLFYDC